MSRTTLRVSLDNPYDHVLARLPELLKEHGFDVLRCIDIGKTMKSALGVEFRRYTILGACNPTLAHRALCVDPDVGALLPCNVAVYEDDSGRTNVAILDLLEDLAHDSDAALREVAAEARTKLQHVVFKLGTATG